jgi:hypothetical protein
MKRIKHYLILTITILLLDPFSAYSQYKPLLIDNSQWYLYHFFEGSCNETYAVIGDTVAFGKTYKIVAANPWCNWNAYKKVLLREDTLGKKVFYVSDPIHNSTEEILYDFGLMPGDTLYSINGIIVLDSITHTLYDFGMHPEVNIFPLNVFYAHCVPQIYFVPHVIWIEGIGSLKGLFEPGEAWGQGVYGGSLLCHYNGNGFRDFHFIDNWEPTPCNGPYMGIPEFEKKELISIFPNPSKDKILIKIEKEHFVVNTEMKLLSCYGQTIIHQQLYQGETEINISNLSSGVYFINVRNDKIERTLKILKE